MDNSNSANVEAPNYMEISAKIIRADGTIEELGVIAKKHRKWYWNFWFKIEKMFDDIFKRVKW